MASRRKRGATAPMSLFAFQDIVTSVTGILLLIAMSMAIQIGKAPAAEASSSDAAEAAALAAQISDAIAEASALESTLADAQADIAEASQKGPGATADEVQSLKSEVEREQRRVNALTDKVGDLAAREAVREAEVAEATERLAVDQQLEEVELLREELRKLRTSNRMLFNVPKNVRGPIYFLELFEGEIRIARAEAAEPPNVFQGGDVVSKAKRFVRSVPRSANWVLFSHPGSTGELSEMREYFAGRSQTIGFDLLPDSVVVIDPSEGAVSP